MTATSTGAEVPAVRTGSTWDRFFFEPQSTSPMTLVRVAWGAVVVLWAMSLLPDIDPFLTEGALRYDRDLPPGSWSPLDWVDWSGFPMAVCLALLVSGVTTMLGYRTRLSTVVAALCLITLQRGNSAIFNSGDLVLRQIGIAVALAPCGLLWSLDARRRGTAAPWRAPWALRLLQLEVAIGYALSAWAKVRGDTWHEGTALGLAMRIEDLQRFVPPEWVFERSIILNLLTWGTLAFEATFIVAVWNRRLRPWVLGAGVAFHLGIDVFLDIGFFSIAMFIAYLAFIPPDVADKIIHRFQRTNGKQPEEPGREDALGGDAGQEEAETEPDASAAAGAGGAGVPPARAP